MSPRIFIADDNVVFRGALKTLLIPDWEIVGEAGNGLRTIEMVEKLKPDLLLLDVNMPKLDGFGVLAHLRKSLPDLKIVILTMYEHLLNKALEAGANGYFVKDCGSNDLIDGIKRVLAGDTVVLTE